MYEMNLAQVSSSATSVIVSECSTIVNEAAAWVEQRAVSKYVVWCGVVWCAVLCCAVLCCAVLQSYNTIHARTGLLISWCNWIMGSRCLQGAMMSFMVICE
jgi:hypothetical protein